MLYLRAFYTIRMAWVHRARLRQINCEEPTTFSTLFFESLKAKGVKTIVFDFDGILSSHGKPVPDPAGIECLNQAMLHFESIFILTNKPKQVRHEYFTSHYPLVTFIHASRKKPYPDGLQEISRLSSNAPSALCLIDDRLLTGCLASVIAGTQIVYIIDPLIDYQYHRSVELFFQCLRKIERVIFGKYS